MWPTRPQDLRLLLLPDCTGNSLATGTAEDRSGRINETEKRGRSGGNPGGKIAEGDSGRRNGHGFTTLGRLQGLRFLRNSAPPRAGVTHLVYGTSKRERKKNDRPIISMMLHWNQSQHPVKALLDTGGSVPLINQRTIEQLAIQTKTYKNPGTIENFSGEVVKGARQSYTGIMCLQHQKHFSKETFEVTPMEAAINIFLPFS